MTDNNPTSVEDRIIHYLQIPSQIAALNASVVRLETKMDMVLAQDKKTEARFEEHEDRLAEVEKRDVAADSKRDLGKYLFEIIWTLILAIIGAGVWLK